MMLLIGKAKDLTRVTLCGLAFGGLLLSGVAAAALPPVSAPAVPGPTRTKHSYDLDLRSMVDRLARAGLRSMRGPSGRTVSLSAFRRELASLRFIYTQDFSKPAGATRWSAFNDPLKRRIYINTAADVSLEAVETLALHEALGALGYPDHNYRYSILARLYLTTAESNFVEEERPFLLKELAEMLLESGANLIPTDPREQMVNDANQRLKKGGADVVGSGGDGAALLYKVKLIESLLGPLGLPSLATLPALRRAVDLSVELTEGAAAPRDEGASIFPDTMRVYIPRRLAYPRSAEEKALAAREFFRIRDFLGRAGGGPESLEPEEP